MYGKGGAVVGAGAAAAVLPNTGFEYAAFLVLAFVLLVLGFAAIRTAAMKSEQTGKHIS